MKWNRQNSKMAVITVLVLAFVLGGAATATRMVWEWEDRLIEQVDYRTERQYRELDQRLDAILSRQEENNQLLRMLVNHQLQPGR